MRRIYQIILIFLISCILVGCKELSARNKCLNYKNFDMFYYNDNLYVLPEEYYDIYEKYDFYGAMHKVGYTIGVYNKIFETYVLDSDVEENILFQKDGGYFWFKEGFKFPDLNELNISKLLIQKLDNIGYVELEKEFDLQNLSLENLFIEYEIDSSVDTFLYDYNNFLTYRIKFIYENGIISNYYDRLTIYNNNLFIENIDEFNNRKIFVLNEDCSRSLLEFILNIKQ